MSKNCIIAALRAIGYSGAQMSWHGFRALASTQLNEFGWNDKWVEMKLVHSDHNKVRKVRNRANKQSASSERPADPASLPILFLPRSIFEIA